MQIDAWKKPRVLVHLEVCVSQFYVVADLANGLAGRLCVMTSTGGTAAAAGFRYQHLVTIEAILELFDSDPEGEWVVGVDLSGQDSADYLIRSSPDARPSVVGQVKASMPTSSTQMTKPDVERILDSLIKEHPHADRYVIRTNRSLTAPAESLVTSGLPPRAEVDFRPSDTVDTLVQRLRSRVTRYRVDLKAPVAGNVETLIIARLRDLIDEKASSLSNQIITVDEVAAVLRLPGQKLARAVGGRQYGRMLGFPIGEYIRRPQVDQFLDHQFGARSDGWSTPTAAVLTGASGAGKSSSVIAWARAHCEEYFCLIWMAAASTGQLAAQVPTILDQLGEPYDPNARPAEALTECLAQIPYPWLVVFDGAKDHSAIADWIPRTGYGHVLITSQDSTWPRSAAPSTTLGALSTAEARDLVTQRLLTPALADPAASHRIDDLARALGYWPLAIDSACHWISRRGGDLSHLGSFLKRLHELDLDDERAVPAGYPRTAVAAVRLTWEELSVETQQFLAMALLCGGHDVPVDVLAAAYEAASDDSNAHALDVERILDELLSTSLARRFIADSHNVSGTGIDRVDIHDAMTVVADGRLVTPVRFLFQLGQELESRVRTLIENVNFREAASYLTASIGLFKVTARQPHEVSRYFAPAMHNTGELLLLTGSADEAAIWFGIASRLYSEGLRTLPDPSPELASLFLGSTAKSVQALLRSGQTEAVLAAGRVVVDLLSPKPHLLQGPLTSLTLSVLIEAVAAVSAEDDPLTVSLQALQEKAPHDTEYSRQGTRFETWSLAVAESADRATLLMAHERWNDGMDDFLSAASRAQEEGALQHEITACGIRVGVALTYSRLQRGLAQPPVPWKNAWQRFEQWADSLESISSSHQPQLDLLRLANDPGQDKTAFAAPIAAFRTQTEPLLAPLELKLWNALIEALTYEDPISQFLMSRLDSLSEEHPWLNVIRTVEGGEDVRVWPFFRRDGIPGVAFVNISAVTHVNGTWVDPQPNMLHAAGLPHDDGSGRAQQYAQGWAATLNGNELIITDANGTLWLQTDLSDLPEWKRWAHRAGCVHLVYADFGDIDPESVDSLPHQGLIALLKPRLWERLWTKLKRRGSAGWFRPSSDVHRVPPRRNDNHAEPQGNTERFRATPD